MWTALIPLVGNIIDKIIPDKEVAAKAKIELLKEENQKYITELTVSSNIVQAEANSEHWLVSAWRPITMLSFVGLIGAHWLGFTPHNLPGDQVIALLDIVQVGIGGYVIGRTAEKTAKAWKGN